MNKKTKRPAGIASEEEFSTEGKMIKIEVGDSTLVPDRSNKSLFSAWTIALIGAITFLILFPLLSSAGFQQFIRNLWYQIFPLAAGQSDPVLDAIKDGSYKNHFMRVLQFVPKGLGVTFQVTISAIVLATFIGLVAGVGQISRNRIYNKISTVYVEIIRGIPLVVQLFFIYYSLGKFLNISGMPSAILAMAICYGAYMGEIFRAGIQAIPKGQMEASLALGMTRNQALTRIILPQTIKVVLPAIGNEFIALLKDSSLVSMLALSDLMQMGKLYATRTFAYFETFLIIGLIYLVITLLLSRLVGIMEERLNRKGKSKI